MRRHGALDVCWQWRISATGWVCILAAAGTGPTCALLLRDLQVVGTADGEVLVVQEGEVRQALQLDGGAGVTSLAAFSKVGGRRWPGWCCLRQGRRAGERPVRNEPRMLWRHPSLPTQ